ncbi:enoyl-CoA hydratase-related protein [Streptomyces sp. NPDC050625]|uniref:enoyl-CoA hydratase/isomerase family protein n=1 Tax=Streptomyces sp. NPDC050625 TaxID=3154629 RepID=UPI003436F060
MADSTDAAPLLVELTGDGVLVLTLNDPATRNALGAESGAELLAQLKRAAVDDEVGAVVLTGADGAFCSGANVKGFARRIADDAKGTTVPGPTPWEILDPVYTLRESVDAPETPLAPELVRRLHTLPKPTIAAVDGTAYGLGCGLALACDFRVASARAKFSEAFVRHGLIPGDGSTWLLTKLVGPATAKWLQMSGEAVDAREALRIGLVNRVTEEEGAALPVALEMATRLAQGPKLAIGMIKQLVNQSSQQDLADHFRIVTRAQEIARRSEDHKEGVAAFKVKRAPRFTGR